MHNYNEKPKTFDTQKRTYAFALGIIKLIDKLPKDTTTIIIGKQLLRSATSIGANVVGGESGSSKRDFVNFFNHSLKSANESQFWLNLLKDSGKTKDPAIIYLIQECGEICKILASSIITLKGKRRF